MSKESNKNDVSGVESFSVLFTWVLVLWGTYEIVGPKEGLSLHQLVALYVACISANYGGKKVENYFINAKK